METLATLDIINLIEKNPVTRLSGDYHHKLVNKVKETFTESQQQLFLSSFYCYLNCDSKDFVISLDNVWKWVGFSRKDAAKKVFLKHFIENVDYVINKNVPPIGGTLQNTGEKFNETILMTVRTFKKFCIKAKTKKADEIHDYYLKMEELLQETIDEETEELRMRLLKDTSENEKVLLVNSSKKRLIYLGLVEKNLVKFGYTKDIESRVRTHKKDFDSFVLKYTIHTDNYIELEEFIKESCNNGMLKDKRVVKEIKGKNQTELIRLDEKFKMENLYEEVIGLNDILEERKRLGFNETIVRLQRDNKRLREENEELRKELMKDGVDLVEKTMSKCRSKKMKEDLPKFKYFLDYLEYFMEKNKQEEKMMLTDTEFFKDYFEYIKRAYSVIYSFKRQKFCLEILRCPSITNDRKTLEKDDPKYKRGRDNRVKVKKIWLEDSMKKWIRENKIIYK